MKSKQLILAPILAMLALVIFLTVLRPIQAAPPTRPLLVPGNPVTDPVSNTHTAPATTTVSITYDEAINPATVSTQTFAVHAMQTGLLTQTYGVNGGEIKLTPTQPFKPGELVQVSATTGTLNLGGQGPISPTVWGFRTAVTSGTGIFADSGQSLGSSDGRDVALGDVDGDGDLDAFVGSGDANKVWLNNGTGTFTDSGQSLGSSTSNGVALGDVDGDGDLDAFVANYTGGPTSGNHVWLNNGAGIFSDSGQNLGFSSSEDVALGDVDGDGDLDAFVANDGVANKVWLNNGTGTFTDSGQSLGSANSRDVALGDVDGDGDLDAFVVNSFGLNQPDKVWLNDGLGVFSDSGQSLMGVGLGQGVALGDVDGDGDLDAFVANYIEFLSGNYVWLNNGAGIFSDSGQNLGSSRSFAVALDDVDGDGDLDAFVGNDGVANKVWLNNGTGTFTDSGQSLGSSSSDAVALGDVDGDGDLDAFVGNGAVANKVWLNQNLVDLGIAKSVMPTGALEGGDAITYTLTYSNAGPQIATGVVITDLVPIPTVTNLSFDSSGASVTPTGSLSYTWQVQDLAPGHGGVITIYGLIISPVTGLFSLTNLTTITASEIDKNNASNQSTVSSQIVGTSTGSVYLPIVVKN